MEYSPIEGFNMGIAVVDEIEDFKQQAWDITSQMQITGQGGLRLNAKAAIQNRVTRDNEAGLDLQIVTDEVVIEGRTCQAAESLNGSVPRRVYVWEAGKPITFFREPSPPLPPVTDVGIVVDVSHWQGEIDWAQMKAKGVTHAYIRSSIGFGEDRYAEANVRGATEQGITYGLYHYFLNHLNAKAQGEFFVTHAPLNACGDLPPALDVETDNQSRHPWAVDLWTWLDLVEGVFQVVPAIYTSRAKWREQLPLAQPWAARYPLWVAHWGAHAPTLPEEWTDWWLWQYAVVDADGYGVQSSLIDVNKFNTG